MFVILGASGKVGTAAVRELRSRDLPVRAVVRDISGSNDLKRLGCEIAVADFHDAAALRRALSGAHAVQAICPMSVRASDALSDMKTMVDTLAEALAATRPAAVVAISDYGAELDAGTGIASLFHYLEARFNKVDTSLTLLRSAEQMQNWSRVVRYVTATGLLPSMHHPLTKSFPIVSAADVGILAADLLMNAAPFSKPRIVHIEGPRRYTPHDVAAALSLALGREVVAHELPRSEWLPLLVRGGSSESYAKLVTDLYDAHNLGRIDAEPGAGEIRRGSAELSTVLAGL
jgi:NAD(P)H dehydrogenase (quinone)